MSDNTGIHSKILTQAARNILRPLGLVQKGRSRTWLDDHGWWIGAVEFQPSNWARGSYLNVGITWLWNVKDYYSYDRGGRAGDFILFESEEQFIPEAEKLAVAAAAVIARFRKALPNINTARELWSPDVSPSFWPDYHAGIAYALSGNIELAKYFFDRVIATDGEWAWMKQGRSNAVHLRELASDTESFRSEISNRVQLTRALLKLPAVDINFDGSAS